MKIIMGAKRLSPIYRIIDSCEKVNKLTIIHTIFIPPSC